jgi:hypothetical protein
MIYDDGHKAVLLLHFSKAFSAKHSWNEMLIETRRSDIVTVDAHLEREPRGLFLVADEIRFAQQPR